MALFGNKHVDGSSDEDVYADTIANSKYREELRAIGRDQFKQVVAKQAEHLEKEVDAMMQRVASDTKVLVARKVDALMGRLNAEITNQINERMREYNRVSGEAQELTASTVARNAQMVHEKFQELSVDLERTVANQEVQMATVFQDSKAHIESVQSEQKKLLDELRATQENTRRDAEELTRELRKTIDSQAGQLNEVYQSNLASVEATRDAQAAMLETLTNTTKALQSQHEQLSELLDKTITDQKAMVAEIINDNMARIVEHYLIGALGEQSNLREQMPAILQQMEENKQAMVDDMKL